MFRQYQQVLLDGEMETGRTSYIAVLRQLCHELGRHTSHPRRGYCCEHDHGGRNVLSVYSSEYYGEMYSLRTPPIGFARSMTSSFSPRKAFVLKPTNQIVLQFDYSS